MKKVLVLLLLMLTIVSACAAVSDVLHAKKIENAVAGGYESLLALENREDSDTFVSPEAYVQEKSLYYQGEADRLYRRAGTGLLCCAALAVLEIGMSFIRRKTKRSEG